MIKKVAILDGRIEFVYHSDEELGSFNIEGVTIEERDMIFDEIEGWVLSDYVKPPTDKQRIEELENMLIMMMEVM